MQLLKKCRDDTAAELNCPNEELELSMGMSADCELAVQHGSSNVRIGSVIFGEREKKWFFSGWSLTKNTIGCNEYRGAPFSRTGESTHNYLFSRGPRFNFEHFTAVWTIVPSMVVTEGHIRTLLWLFYSGQLSLMASSTVSNLFEQRGTALPSSVSCIPCKPHSIGITLRLFVRPIITEFWPMSICLIVS